MAEAQRLVVQDKPLGRLGHFPVSRLLRRSSRDAQ
jgi:hypothetical protein